MSILRSFKTHCLVLFEVIFVPEGSLAVDAPVAARVGRHVRLVEGAGVRLRRR